MNSQDQEELDRLVDANDQRGIAAWAVKLLTTSLTIGHPGRFSLFKWYAHTIQEMGGGSDDDMSYLDKSFVVRTNEHPVVRAQACLLVAAQALQHHANVAKSCDKTFQVRRRKSLLN
jgi:hypothetical protein